MCWCRARLNVRGLGCSLRTWLLDEQVAGLSHGMAPARIGQRIDAAPELSGGPEVRGSLNSKSVAG